MPCFVNLPSRWIKEQPLWAEWFANASIHPELGLDLHSLALPRSWHKDMAARFRDAGLICSVHLPFLGVDPTDLNDDVAAGSRDALRRAAEVAAIYEARHMIGHPYFRFANRPERLKDDMRGRWLEMGLKIWPELPTISGATLYLENTYEQDPEAIAVLVEAVRETGTSMAGVCFDLGHWHTFARCATREELMPWLDAFCRYPLHLHLHDNDATADKHMGLGLGTVPLEMIFDELEARRTKVTATQEPHDLTAFLANVDWLEARPEIASLIDWSKPKVEALPLEAIEKHLAI